MSILYYSKYLFQKLLLHMNTNNLHSDTHFICIDKRLQDPNTNKYTLFLKMDNKSFFQKHSNVPALMLLNNNYKVLYGDDIYSFLRPVVEKKIEQGTNFNMEPSCFSFASDSSGLGVVSDQYSFLDQSSEEMGTKGQGGTRQMYNYMGMNEQQWSGTIETPTDDFQYSKGNQEVSGGSEMTIEQLQKQRDAEFASALPSGPGYGPPQGQGI